MALPFFYARYFWHYTVAQKSARDAAVFMARLPLKDMEDRNRRLAAIVRERQEKFALSAGKDER